MDKLLINNNAPDIILEVAKKWHEQGKSFYLGPENIFTYNNLSVNYLGGEILSREFGSWSVYTDDITNGVPATKNFFLSYEELSELVDTIRQNAVPTNAIIFLSTKCCSHCFMCPYHGDDTSYFDIQLAKKHVEVPFETAKEWIDKLYDCGVRNIGIGAHGELFVIPYWEELMRYTATKEGLTQYVITNGMLVTEEVVEKINDIGNVTFVEVSLHGTNFETWSSVTGVKNKKLFENAVNAPLLFKEIGIPVFTAFVQTPRNQHNLKEFLDYWTKYVDGISVLYRNEIGVDLEVAKVQHGNNDPYNLCKNMTDSLHVCPDGSITPCYAAYSLLNDEEMIRVGIKNINDLSSKELLDYFRSFSHLKSYYKSACDKCTKYFRYSSNSEELNIYGHKAVREDIHYRVFGEKKSRKKTLQDRIRIEVHGLKRAIKKITHNS